MSFELECKSTSGNIYIYIYIMCVQLKICLLIVVFLLLVPGVMGSQLEARLHKANSSKWYCYKNYDEWYRLWLNLDDILPLAQNCFKENIK